jgi:hypothetical protein
MKLKGIGSEGVDSIRLHHDSVKWRALVNAVMNFWLYETRGICGTAEELWILCMKFAPWNSLVLTNTLV